MTSASCLWPNIDIVIYAGFPGRRRTGTEKGAKSVDGEVLLSSGINLCQHGNTKLQSPNATLHESCCEDLMVPNCMVRVTWLEKGWKGGVRGSGWVWPDTAKSGVCRPGLAGTANFGRDIRYTAVSRHTARSHFFLEFWDPWDRDELMVSIADEGKLCQTCTD